MTQVNKLLYTLLFTFSLILGYIAINGLVNWHIVLISAAIGWAVGYLIQHRWTFPCQRK